MALEAALVAEGIRLVFQGSRSRAVRPLTIAGGLLAATLLYGAVRIHQVDSLRALAPSASIAIVEPATEATERWDEHQAQSILARLTTLTLRAEADGAELVVWPEDAYPYSLAHVSRRGPSGANAVLQAGVRGPVLAGVIMTGQVGRYNSAILATRDGKLSDPYD
jgi:apolipoprotein N-acyltransferase